MFNFGEFYELESDTANYSVWELLVFTLIGVKGGLVGAATCHVSKSISLRRRSQTVRENGLEVHLVCAVCACTAFFLPLFLGRCSPRPDPNDADAGYTSQVSFPGKRKKKEETPPPPPPRKQSKRTTH